LRKAGFALGLLVVLSTPPAQSATLLIKPDGTGDYPTIQAGLNAAATGDTVLLAPGTYTGPQSGYIDFPPVVVTLLSQAGADETTILGSNLQVANVGSDGSTVDGISVVGAPQWALLCNHRSITVRHCVFSDNVLLLGSSTVVEYCLFRGNGAVDSAIRCSSGGFAVIRNCVFVDNAFGERGVIDIAGASPAIVNNTFVRNANLGVPADPLNAVLYIYDSSSLISYNIIAFTAGGRATQSFNANPAYTCNDFFGNVSGDGPFGTNFSADPLFCVDYPLDDVTIKASSPCAPQNSPCGNLVGAMPVACAECPPADRTMDPGARQRFSVSLYNNTDTAGYAFYLVQGDASLTFEMEDQLDGFVPSLFGLRSIDPHASLMLLAWVQVAEDAVPDDSLRFHIVSGLASSTEDADTCIVNVNVGSNPVGVGGEPPPLRAVLSESMPNPFSSSTRFRYVVPSGAGEVSLSIYDAAGRHIRTLLRREVVEGEHLAEWDGTDDANARVTSGVYFCVLRGRAFRVSTKLLLLR
jgi:FlgD Ig-like domain